jgi:hypothetical protein
LASSSATKEKKFYSIDTWLDRGLSFLLMTTSLMTSLTALMTSPTALMTSLAAAAFVDEKVQVCWAFWTEVQNLPDWEV